MNINYYWSSWLGNRGTVLQKVSEEHPFKEVYERNKDKNEWVLLNYKEITKEEYDIFSKEVVGNYNYCELDSEYYIRRIKYGI
jgi:hypothetical protein